MTRWHFEVVQVCGDCVVIVTALFQHLPTSYANPWWLMHLGCIASSPSLWHASRDLVNMGGVDCSPMPDGLATVVGVGGGGAGRPVASGDHGDRATAGFSLGFIPPVRSLRGAVPEDAVALGVSVVVALVAGLVAGQAQGRRDAVEPDETSRVYFEYRRVVAEREELAAQAARVQALESLDRQRSLLLRSVSHDLRTHWHQSGRSGPNCATGTTTTPPCATSCST
jgi:hypothetical protein